MPGKVKVKIISGKNLPVMDRSSDTTDAYVEIKLGSTTYKTDVCRKSLHPQWNSEWYRFEVDDSELQDEPLQIRLMDHDTYSANDAIGKVYLNLNPLLLPAVSQFVKYNEPNPNHDSTGNSVMSGWIPVYDTMHGIRGEVNIIVKVELFSDFNRYRQSSCGVQFYCSPSVPQGFNAQVIHGFVEELIVDDDPEYQWIDKIRTPRASNEARQTLFFKLSGELQRKIGVKALNLGGNAVIGYRQQFDLEGECGIVARGIGTAVTLIKTVDIPTTTVITATPNDDKLDENNSPIPDQLHPNGCPTPETKANSPNKINATHRRSSDSDLSITPKAVYIYQKIDEYGSRLVCFPVQDLVGNSLTGSDRSGGTGAGGYFMRNNAVLRSQVHQENFDMLEYPFLTMSKFPPGFVVQIGGAVSARSVKLLERISNVEEPESRDTWWSELRMEIRSHARSLNCNAVLGYSETTSICDDVCVLSATGTAAVIGFVYNDEVEDSIGNLPVIQKPNVAKNIMTSSLDRNFDKDKCVKDDKVSKTLFESPEHLTNGLGAPPCTLTHLPYDLNNVPVRSTIYKCGTCMKGKVPDILISTIEPPDNLPTIGRGCFLEAILHRPLKDVRGESIAKDISDGLPFLEYELHRLLINKLKIKGMNSIFGLKIKITIGERMIIGIATGTALFLGSLPSPTIPKLISDRTSDETKVTNWQRDLNEAVRKNRDIYQLKGIDDMSNGRILSDNEDSEEDSITVDFSLGNKDCCVLEVDDHQDEAVLNLLVESPPPDGFHVVNTETVPGLDDLEIVKNLQMFTQIYRVKIQANFSLHKHFKRLLETVYFKLRRMIPCALCDLEFRIDLPEPEELQLCVIGMALGLGKTQKKLKVRKNDEDLIFKLDEDQVVVNDPKNKQKSPSKGRTSVKQRHIPYKERHGVDITPLSYVPGGKIERYLGNLNFFFIRETTSIREEGGLSGFIHSFMTEVLAIVRAHVTALGGNALVAYFMTECVLNHSLYKNQGQCLINVGGDVVFVSYFKEDT